MGEIKSTLEIIMEKTKDLTLSESEKEALQRKELANEAKGLVQKFLDGLMNTRTLQAAMESHKEDLALLTALLRKEAMERVAPEGNNDKAYEVLEEVLGLDATPVQRALAAFHKKVKDASAERQERLRNNLESLEITGPAVLPNLANDPTWSTFYEGSKRAFKEQVRLISNNQTTDAQSSGS